MAIEYDGEFEDFDGEFEEFDEEYQQQFDENFEDQFNEKFEEMFEEESKEQFDEESEIKSEESSETELDIADDDIKNKLTWKKDCVTYEDTKENFRIKMGCGHVFCPKSIRKWYKMSFQKHDEITEAICPMENCNFAWTDKHLKYGGFSEWKFDNYNKMIKRRKFFSELKSCPNCDGFVERPTDLTMNRIACQQCNGADFCFTCSKPWKKNGYVVCGNSGCGTEAILFELQNCPTIKHSFSTKKVPKIRACPSCLTLIEHIAACNHMKCFGCGENFCFICLEKFDKTKGWPCKNPEIVAPRQTLE